jgi:cysteine sulfinate desulfinase/cysteine desulfurase-like protein
MFLLFILEQKTEFNRVDYLVEILREFILVRTLKIFAMSRYRNIFDISGITGDAVFRALSGVALGLGAACSVLAIKNYYRYKKLRRGIK